MNLLQEYHKDAARASAKKLADLVRAVSRLPAGTPPELLAAAADAIAEGRARVKEMLYKEDRCSY